MIRITGGINRSRLLETPNVLTTKPTMDKVRLGVFSALGSKVENANVLDLFAGSGSYGFESLSRGAKSVTFVDNNKDACNSIRKNKELLKIIDANIILNDSISYLKNCKEKYDIIFMDPPYKLDIYGEALDIIISNDLLENDGILVFESEKELDLDFSSFKFYKFYKYGLAKIYIIRR